MLSESILNPPPTFLSGYLEKKNTLAQSERSISCFRKTACWKEKSMSFALHTILNFIVPRKMLAHFAMLCHRGNLDMCC